MRGLPVNPVVFRPSPCDDCRHAVRCGRHGLACEAFGQFVVGHSRRRWEQARRVPTADRLRLILADVLPRGGRPRSRGVDAADAG